MTFSLVLFVIEIDTLIGSFLTKLDLIMHLRIVLNHVEAVLLVN